MNARGALARRLLAAVLVIAAIALVVGSLRTPGVARTRPRTSVVGTPLWSIRRVPQPIVDAVGAQHLQSTLQTQTSGSQSCFVVTDALGTIASANPDQALIPASTMKLLTATAALMDLGADFHFTTIARWPKLAPDGSVSSLDLIGGGDPLLATPEYIDRLAADPETAGLTTTPLAALADRIAAAGVRAAPGGVVVHDDRYDGERARPDWSAGARAAIGPIGALTVNDGFTGPAGTGAAAVDPALNAATQLTRMLAVRGVTVGPPHRNEAAGPIDASDVATRATIDSAPLPALITELLSSSDNLTAEALLKELGARAGSGTTKDGIAAARTALTKLGVDLASVTMVDGSGLSRADAVPCRTLQRLLQLSARPELRPIADGLAVAALRGTLATRFVNTELAGNLRAKTGTLSGVSALAGFVTSDRLLTFSTVLNGDFGEDAAFSRREGIATTIAAFPQTSSGAQLVPAPNAPIPSRACPRTESPC